ncbi:protein of unknown function (plasmid) [Pararobbsia alpina]
MSAATSGEPVHGRPSTAKETNGSDVPAPNAREQRLAISCSLYFDVRVEASIDPCDDEMRTW